MPHRVPCTYDLFHGAIAHRGQGSIIFEASRSHSDTPHSVGLLWASNQASVETFTWQHSTLTRDRHSWARWDSKPQSQ